MVTLLTETGQTELAAIHANHNNLWLPVTALEPPMSGVRQTHRSTGGGRRVLGKDSGMWSKPPRSAHGWLISGVTGTR